MAGRPTWSELMGYFHSLPEECKPLFFPYVRLLSLFERRLPRSGSPFPTIIERFQRVHDALVSLYRSRWAALELIHLYLGWPHPRDLGFPQAEYYQKSLWDFAAFFPTEVPWRDLLDCFSSACEEEEEDEEEGEEEEEDEEEGEEEEAEEGGGGGGPQT